MRSTKILLALLASIWFAGSAIAVTALPGPTDWLKIVAVLVLQGLGAVVFVLLGQRPGYRKLGALGFLMGAAAVALTIQAGAGLLLAGVEYPVLRQERMLQVAVIRLVLGGAWSLLITPVLASLLRRMPVAQTYTGSGIWQWPSGGSVALILAALVVVLWPAWGALGSSLDMIAHLLTGLAVALAEEPIFRGVALWLFADVSTDLKSTANPFRAQATALWLSAGLFTAFTAAGVLDGSNWAALASAALAPFFAFLLMCLPVRPVTRGGSIWGAVALRTLFVGFPALWVDWRVNDQVWQYGLAAYSALVIIVLAVLLFAFRWRARTEPRRSAAFAAGWPVLRRGLAGLAWIGVLGVWVFFGRVALYEDGFMIVLKQQADPQSFVQNVAAEQRPTAVYQGLTGVAKRTQAPIRAELDRLHVSYHSYYLVNAIRVDGNRSLMGRFASRSDVAELIDLPNVRQYARRANAIGLAGDSNPSAGGIPWGVARIGAPQAWQNGIRGQGIVVASNDTGVDPTHEAIRSRYRGTSGDPGYAWHDAWNDNPTQAFDEDGHGTHTVGTMVGGTATEQIGVAPASQWIACRNMRMGIGSPFSYLECLEWSMAPYSPKGDPLSDGRPDLAAHVINNSWGCPKREGCRPAEFAQAARALKAAGVLVVVSAGNDGPNCSTIDSPAATWPDVFTVGASTRSDGITSFSSRGPVTADGSNRVKPDISAPGSGVRSALPGNRYANLDGTSMAGPHVAGAVALLWSADRSLLRNPDATIQRLRGSADPARLANGRAPGLSVPTAQDATCGGKEDVEGAGILNVAKALQDSLKTAWAAGR